MAFNTEFFNITRPARKEKVVVVMGATGIGKSKLSIDLATHFPAEIINSDKIKIYKGLDVVTNKVTEEEQRERSLWDELWGFCDFKESYSSSSGIGFPNGFNNEVLVGFFEGHVRLLEEDVKDNARKLGWRQSKKIRRQREHKRCNINRYARRRDQRVPRIRE